MGRADQFNGVADLGEPGEPAYTGVVGTGLSGAEICTGGGIYGSATDQALYTARPAALGGATPSLTWGDGGVIDLSVATQYRSDISVPLDDFGSRVRSFDGGAFSGSGSCNRVLVLTVTDGGPRGLRTRAVVYFPCPRHLAALQSPAGLTADRPASLLRWNVAQEHSSSCQKLVSRVKGSGEWTTRSEHRVPGIYREPHCG